MTKTFFIVVLPHGLTKWLNYLVKTMNTVQQILDAARKLFMVKGLEGTRMQEIADEAGINKALLHYYFRSKDKLFARIFDEAFQKILPSMAVALDRADNVQAFVRFFVPNYIKILNDMPFLPQFVIHELAQNPSRIAGMMQVKKFPLQKLDVLLVQSIERGEVRQIATEHFLINMLSMTIFPYMARPIMEAVVFQNDKERYAQFLNERAQEVIKTILLSLRIENETNS